MRGLLTYHQPYLPQIEFCSLGFYVGTFLTTYRVQQIIKRQTFPPAHCLLLKCTRESSAQSAEPQTPSLSEEDKSDQEQNWRLPGETHILATSGFNCKNWASWSNMVVSWNRGTPKSSIVSRIVHYKPTILGYLHLRKPPYMTVGYCWHTPKILWLAWLNDLTHLKLPQSHLSLTVLQASANSFDGSLLSQMEKFWRKFRLWVTSEL